ncbi:hypothetical protein [Achromobacter sp.]|uniref:hypothetical protein n=1 Tax=Achromobacter sp. TaxID=134375 RepID=UPI0028AC953C|nr:hypothetical protein [Achromobacter sp.]
MPSLTIFIEVEKMPHEANLAELSEECTRGNQVPPRTVQNAIGHGRLHGAIGSGHKAPYRPNGAHPLLRLSGPCHLRAELMTHKERRNEQNEISRPADRRVFDHGHQ